MDGALPSRRKTVITRTRKYQHVSGSSKCSEGNQGGCGGAGVPSRTGGLNAQPSECDQPQQGLLQLQTPHPPGAASTWELSKLDCRSPGGPQVATAPHLPLPSPASALFSAQVLIPLKHLAP